MTRESLSLFVLLGLAACEKHPSARDSGTAEKERSPTTQTEARPPARYPLVRLDFAVRLAEASSSGQLLLVPEDGRSVKVYSLESWSVLRELRLEARATAMVRKGNCVCIATEQPTRLFCFREDGKDLREVPLEASGGLLLPASGTYAGDWFYFLNLLSGGLYAQRFSVSTLSIDPEYCPRIGVRISAKDARFCLSPSGELLYLRDRHRLEIYALPDHARLVSETVDIDAEARDVGAYGHLLVLGREVYDPAGRAKIARLPGSATFGGQEGVWFAAWTPGGSDRTITALSALAAQPLATTVADVVPRAAVAAGRTICVFGRESSDTLLNLVRFEEENVAESGPPAVLPPEQNVVELGRTYSQEVRLVAESGSAPQLSLSAGPRGVALRQNRVEWKPSLADLAEGDQVFLIRLKLSTDQGNARDLPLAVAVTLPSIRMGQPDGDPGTAFWHMTQDGAQLLTLVPERDEVRFYSVALRKQLAAVRVGGRPRALVEHRGMAYVLCDSLYAVSLATHAVQEARELSVSAPLSMCVPTGSSRLYVCGESGGQAAIEVIDLERGTIAAALRAGSMHAIRRLWVSPDQTRFVGVGWSFSRTTDLLVGKIVGRNLEFSTVGPCTYDSLHVDELRSRIYANHHVYSVDPPVRKLGEVDPLVRLLAPLPAKPFVLGLRPHEAQFGQVLLEIYNMESLARLQACLLRRRDRNSLSYVQVLTTATHAIVVGPYEAILIPTELIGS